MEPVEKANFAVRSFEKKWSMQTPNIKCVKDEKNRLQFIGEPVDLDMYQLKTILGFEGLESIKEDMWEAMKIYKYLTHETFAVTVQLIEEEINYKKKFKQIKEKQMPYQMEQAFFGILKRNGNEALIKQVEDYENNFLFETEQTVQQMEKMIVYFDCLSINWIKEIEKQAKKEFNEMKQNALN